MTAPLFRAGRQAWKVRSLMLLSLACAGASLYWGYDLLLTYGLLPGDGGVLRPLWQRAAWALTVAGLGVGFAAGMWIYARHYVSEVVMREDDRMLLVRTLGLFGSRVVEVPFADVRTGRRHDGEFNPQDFGLNSGLRVKAPWVAIYIKGRRRPLILDLQGEVADRDESRQLAGDAQPLPSRKRKKRK